MDKNSFLKQLSERLRHLPENERKDILYDYEQHINEAVLNGETEDQVVGKLGSPELIARQFAASKVIREAEVNKSTGNVLRAVIATLGLGLMNLIFIVGPFFAILGCLIGFAAAGLAFVVSGVAIAGSGLFGLLGGNLNWVIHAGTSLSFHQDYFSLGLLGAGVSVGAFGGLFTMATFWLSQAFYKVTIQYLKVNMRIIQGEPLSGREKGAQQ